MDRFGGELNDGARFDVTPWADVVRETSRRRANRIAVSVIIGIDDDDWFFGSHVDDELSSLALLLGRQRQVFARVRTHRSINVKPAVHYAHLDEAVDPRFV